MQAHVNVAKAGVDALSNAVAIEFGPRGITSNVIAPGPIAGTEGLERLARKEDAIAGQKVIPLGRWGTVREIADATVYLFSEAAGYVTGTTLVGEFGYLPYRFMFSPLRVFNDDEPEVELICSGLASFVLFLLRSSTRCSAVFRLDPR